MLDIPRIRRQVATINALDDAGNRGLRWCRHARLGALRGHQPVGIFDLRAAPSFHVTFERGSMRLREFLSPCEQAVPDPLERGGVSCIGGAPIVGGYAENSAKRASSLPSIPTLNESGLPGYDLSGWYGVLAPAGVPKDIIARLNAVIANVVNTPEMKEALNKQGLEPQTNTPEQFAAFIHNEIARSAMLIKLTGAKAE
jgi:hypothetical protein